jgi:hypothetical protein
MEKLLSDMEKQLEELNETLDLITSLFVPGSERTDETMYDGIELELDE